jgi:hypothetical protein
LQTWFVVSILFLIDCYLNSIELYFIYTVFYIYENIITNNESARQENYGIRISQRTDDCQQTTRENNSGGKFNHQAIICLHVRSMAFSINKALIYFTFLW